MFAVVAPIPDARKVAEVAEVAATRKQSAISQPVRPTGQQVKAADLTWPEPTY
jgi:hypothetical protein